jgi:hypothetical protein
MSSVEPRWTHDHRRRRILATVCMILVALVLVATVVVVARDDSGAESRLKSPTSRAKGNRGTHEAPDGVGGVAPLAGGGPAPEGIGDLSGLQAALATEVPALDMGRAEMRRMTKDNEVRTLSDYSELGPLWTAGTYFPFGDQRREVVGTATCFNTYADLGGAADCRTGSVQVRQATPRSDLVWLYRTVQRQDGRGGWVRLGGTVNYFGDALGTPVSDVSGWFFATCGRPTREFPYVTQPNECGNPTGWHAWQPPNYRVSSGASLGFSVPIDGQNLWTVVQDELFYVDDTGHTRPANLYRSWIRPDGSVY